MDLNEIKIGKRKLRMSSGEVREFRSKRARDRFERAASIIKAAKHRGWDGKGGLHSAIQFLKTHRETKEEIEYPVAENIIEEFLDENPY